MRRNDSEELAQSTHNVVPSCFDLYFILIQLVCLDSLHEFLADILSCSYCITVFFFIPITQPKLLLLKIYPYYYITVPFTQSDRRSLLQLELNQPSLVESTHSKLASHSLLPTPLIISSSVTVTQYKFLL